MTIFALLACAAGNVAPVQLNVIVPAAAVTPAFNVTVNVSPENKAEFDNAEGAVNVQTGEAGHVKPAKVVAILPAAEIGDGALNVMLTVVAVDDAKVELNVTAPLVIDPQIAESVPVSLASISALDEDLVFKTTSVLAN